MDFIKEDDSYTEDTRKREEADLQKLTDEFIKSIDSIVKEKDAEIMAV